jgi:hypothetical protein
LSLETSILETLHCYQDCRHDLEHLKFLYDMNLRDRKLFVDPIWKPYNVRYNEIPGKIGAITAKVEQLKQKGDNAEKFNMDYYALMGLPCGCDQLKLERAYCLLDLRYQPETTIRFITRCKLADEQDVQPVKHRARMSIDLFYKLHQKGYSSVHVGANGGRWFCSYNKLLQMQMHMNIQLLNCKKQVLICLQNYLQTFAFECFLQFKN